MLFPEGCIFSLYLKKNGFPQNTEVGHRGRMKKRLQIRGLLFSVLFCFALLLGLKKKKIPVHVYAFRYPHVCRLKTKWLSHTMYKKK